MSSNVQRVVSWSSRKNTDGTFTATVYSFDHGAPRVVHAEHTLPTRARAVAAAKRDARYLRRIR